MPKGRLRGLRPPQRVSEPEPRAWGPPFKCPRSLPGLPCTWQGPGPAISSTWRRRVPGVAKGVRCDSRPSRWQRRRCSLSHLRPCLGTTWRFQRLDSQCLPNASAVWLGRWRSSGEGLFQAALAPRRYHAPLDECHCHRAVAAGGPISKTLPTLGVHWRLPQSPAAVCSGPDWVKGGIVLGPRLP